MQRERKASTSRQRYIKASCTPVTHLNLKAATNKNPQTTRAAIPPMKEFRSYAQARQESKQRNIDSHRSLENNKDSEA